VAVTWARAAGAVSRHSVTKPTSGRRAGQNPSRLRRRAVLSCLLSWHTDLVLAVACALILIRVIVTSLAFMPGHEELWSGRACRLAVSDEQAIFNVARNICSAKNGCQQKNLRKAIYFNTFDHFCLSCDTSMTAMRHSVNRLIVRDFYAFRIFSRMMSRSAKYRGHGPSVTVIFYVCLT